MVATIVLASLVTVRGSVASLSLLLLRVPDFAALAVWVASAFGYGAATFGRSKLMNRPLRIVTSIAIGMGVESLLVLAFGLVGFINVGVSWGILLLGGLLAVWKRGTLTPFAGTPGAGGREHNFELRKSFDVQHHPHPHQHPDDLPGYRESGPDASSKGVRWLWLLPIAVLTVSCLCAMLPPGLLWGDEPNGYDVVEYHLQVPREWYEIGRIAPLTHNVFSYFPFNVEMHYLLAMMTCHGPWAGMYLAQMMHVAFISLAVMAVYGLLADVSRTAATVAAVAMAATPWCGLLASVAYDEGGYLLWGTLAVGLLLRREVFLAAVMAGLACGAKWTAVPIVLLAAPVAVWATRIISGRSVLLYWLIGVAVVSPWLLRNVAWSRDPVFPEMTGLFGKATWSDAQVQRWHDAHVPRADQQGIVAHVKAMNEQVFEDWRFGFVFLPAGLLAAALCWRDPRTDGMALILGALAVFWLFFTHLQGRFFVLALPLSAMLIGRAAIRWPRQSAACVCATGMIGLSLFLRRVVETDSRLFQLIGVSKLGGFTPFAESPPAEDASVVLIGDAKAFWYQMPTPRLFYRTVFDVDVEPGQSVVDAWSAGTPTSNSARVIDPGELIRFSRTYTGIPRPPIDVLQMPGPSIDWGTVQPAKAF